MKTLAVARTVATVHWADQDDDHTHANEEQEPVDAVNSVSVAFPNPLTTSAEFIKFVSLFDTGSPRSFVRRSVLPYGVTGTLQPIDLYGIGGKELKILGKVNCRILFKNQIETLNLMILPNDAMQLPLV